MLAALIASSRRVWVEDMVGMLAKIGLTFFVRMILDEKMRMSLVRPAQMCLAIRTYSSVYRTESEDRCSWFISCAPIIDVCFVAVAKTASDF